MVIEFKFDFSKSMVIYCYLKSSFIVYIYITQMGYKMVLIFSYIRKYVAIIRLILTHNIKYNNLQYLDCFIFIFYIVHLSRHLYLQYT